MAPGEQICLLIPLHYIKSNDRGINNIDKKCNLEYNDIIHEKVKTKTKNANKSLKNNK